VGRGDGDRDGPEAGGIVAHLRSPGARLDPYAEHLSPNDCEVDTALISIVIIGGVFLVQIFVQRGISARYDWQCANCGQSFSAAPTATVVAPHRLGGSKYLKCPNCGTRAWDTRVPKQ
jgi:DNA-directed RNA polymerase subunit RPC12/RpoP